MHHSPNAYPLYFGESKTGLPMFHNDKDMLEEIENFFSLASPSKVNAGVPHRIHAWSH